MFAFAYCENEAILLGEMKKVAKPICAPRIEDRCAGKVTRYSKDSHDPWSLHCSSNTARALVCMHACVHLVLRIVDRRATRTYDVIELQTPTARVVHSGANKRIYIIWNMR